MEDARKQHRPPTAGKKVKKKKAEVARHNPKAFTFSGGWKSTQKRAQRQAEIAEKREKFERIVNKSPSGAAPPYIVVVQGPPGCGKSTLIKSLIKHYTKQSVGAINGPITCVVSKARRLTFIECPNDLPGMMDLAKVTDLAIVMIDSESGLEMTTFEFINIMQNHGFPRILGVLTKLDRFKDNKSLKKFKKNMKHRFWTEIYDGAKLFYLTGLQGKRYLKREIFNLSRFVSVQKYESLLWRSQRPYILGLNLEVIPYKSDIDTPGTRSVAISGYLRGARLRHAQTVHIPGCGDFQLKTIEQQMDPCPPPSIRKPDSKDSAKLTRKLKQQDKLIFAPNCDIGQVEVEGSSMFIKLPSNRAYFTPSQQLLDVHQQQKAKEEIEAAASTAAESNSDWSTSSDSGSEPELSSNEELSDAESVSESDIKEDELDAVPENQLSAIRMVRKLQQSEGVLDEVLRQRKLRLTSRSNRELEAAEALQLEKLMEAHDEFEETERIDINRVEIEGQLAENLGNLASVAQKLETSQGSPFLYGQVYESRRGLPLPKTEDGQDLFDDDGDCVSAPEGDLNAFDTTRVPASLRLSPINRWLSVMDAKETDTSVVHSEDLRAIFTKQVMQILRATAFITGGWDDGPDEEISLATNKLMDIEAFAKDCLDSRRRQQIEQADMAEEACSVISKSDDFSIGSFVRIIIQGVDENWIAKTTANGLTRPVILGGILSGEQSLTFLNARVKRHRWSPGILKTTEPLLFSIGWRRFQSLPYFALEDRNSVRLRYLKYSPEHMHCLSIFYGHAAPPGTGILAIKHSGDKLADFRISLTGVVIENDPNPSIFKKIKFLGSPSEIKRNTAFVKGMFSSDLEVSKAAGAAIQTQSGVKGVIKKARGYEGEFRATFEAQILKSDIVFCKAWYKVPLEDFCNPQTDDGNWDRVRTFVELRRELQIPVSENGACKYGPRQQREIKAMKKLKLAPQLLQALPYKSIPRTVRKKTEAEQLMTEALRVTKTPYERLVGNLINRASAEKNRKLEHRKQKLSERISQMEKTKSKIEETRAEASRERKKSAYVRQGKDVQRARKKLRLDQ
eukprot:Gregarina_sp_Poly_1__5692@NODE_2_length_28028_cov_167_134223_g1_i0_p2_GENE_NODE_2_length_28028_cov_167_134223_g1_i0NODE_2_length_28028_cov_167_134223_g1_i0_p2_ORF_typecomplete_len1075_score187_84RIBIOP_C/PF04950_12/7e02RIBIOP_C/PF04950_12/2e77AARP2CN/PF08142_12/6_3e24PduVEutP/PF10662_9/1_1e12GTP_EFTU/PF00009_27/9_2e10AAA_22/PF13401_6/2_1e05AAA_16/PF13191_6/4_1e05Adeno_IVa2/PF02456_15/2_4e05NACHT/PF05729_12/0_00018NACHT/PF05729_12/6e02AAA_30/PF13604_6/8_8e05KAP_NTPase/PF07693_14/0_0002KAP_NTPase/